MLTPNTESVFKMCFVNDIILSREDTFPYLVFIPKVKEAVHIQRKENV